MSMDEYSDECMRIAIDARRAPLMQQNLRRRKQTRLNRGLGGEDRCHLGNTNETEETGETEETMDTEGTLEAQETEELEKMKETEKTEEHGGTKTRQGRRKRRRKRKRRKTRKTRNTRKTIPVPYHGSCVDRSDALDGSSIMRPVSTGPMHLTDPL